MALTVLAPLSRLRGTVSAAVKAPLVVLITRGSVGKAAPLSASVTCSVRPKPAPLTITVAPGLTRDMLNEIRGVNCCTVTAALAERLLVAPVAVTMYEADLRLEGMVMPVGGSTPLASALAVAAVPLSAIVTISCAAKPLPQTVTRPPQVAVAGVIAR